MSSVKGGFYQRGEFWLDLVRGAGGRPASSKYYIWWYDPASGKQRRKSTRTDNVRLACDALDAHYLARHQPTSYDRDNYTVSEALTDYFVEHGQGRPSAESIRARLKLISRFIDHEAQEGRLRDPFLPKQVNDAFLKRFRTWALADPIVARKKDQKGNWVAGSSRQRSPATVEESVIQFKAALKHAENAERIAPLGKLKHLTRDEVTPQRTYRLSVDGIAEMLDFAAIGSGSYAGHADRLIPLRRFLVGAICTIARPDAIMDMSVTADRGQWMRRERRFDLNPAGRIQTKKLRPVLPVADLLNEWLEATDDFLVCRHIYRPVEGSPDEEEATQVAVASVRSAWDTMRGQLKLPSGWGPKLIRHSMATILANRGINIFELKIALGHQPLGKTTDRYVIFSPDYLQSYSATLSDVLADLNKRARQALLPPPRLRKIEREHRK